MQTATEILWKRAEQVKQFKPQQLNFSQEITRLNK